MDGHAHWCRSRDLGEWKACNCGATGRYAPTEDNGPGSAPESVVRHVPAVAQGQHATSVPTGAPMVHTPTEQGNTSRETATVHAEQRRVPRYDGEPAPEPIMQHFGYSHLPLVMQDVSRHFHDLAHWVVDNLPRNAERTVALRKILEAKDCAVRAFIAKK